MVSNNLMRSLFVYARGATRLHVLVYVDDLIVARNGGDRKIQAVHEHLVSYEALGTAEMFFGD